jgi:CheY-like chemotaxis protein
MLHALEAAQTALVKSGTEALEQMLANPGRFDAVIADATMDKGSGLQLLQSIRCGEVVGARPDTCCVLTALALSEPIAKTARVLDVNGFLAKPFSKEMLSSEIAKARQRIHKIDFARYRSISTNPVDLGTLQPSLA